ncbi:hypothetical protein EPUS_07101 [Endocarpon pusillum Z07020]|uniref:Uncharacterized protein n=1 Tax=Endocarpon pusillum (strain Z07020 / HMAS-L-300199) TaxID=1263415 RepID=U1G6K1_ENDPU|nr:uncharacterized protein EPUS_07101 [Endocarpon pusillum Z07020]ERF73007.1 hypothetical protein EPUS_07101 [Endocarpon pusillum Z07020]
MDTVVLPRYSLPRKARTYTKPQPDNKRELRGTLSSSAHHGIDLKQSCSKKFIDVFTRASQTQVIASNQIESPLDTSPILAEIGDMITCSQKAIDRTYGLEKFIFPIAAALGLYEDQSAKQIINRSFLTIHVGSVFRKAAVGESGHLGDEIRTPIVCGASPNSDVASEEVNTISMLFAKLSPAHQDASITLAPGDGAEDGRQQEHREEDEDDGENYKQPKGRKSRGKGPRKQNEFACPFFKHDPRKYGGRGGCREYSHEKVGNLLRDHIGNKHLRDNDIDATMWLRLKETKNLRGAARYREMYALLFPDDQAGIQNPYYHEQEFSASLPGRGHNLPIAELTAAALEQVENIKLLDMERAEKETQIRVHAELDLDQIQIDLDAQILKSKEAAREKKLHERLACNEELDEVRREMSQRRQSIENRLESILHGQGPDMSTETSIEYAEAGGRTGIAIDENQSVAGDQRGVSEMGRAIPTTPSSTIASNIQSSSGIGAGNSWTSNGRLLAMEAFETGLQNTPAFTHQASRANALKGHSGNDVGNIVVVQKAKDNFNEWQHTRNDFDGAVVGSQLKATPTSSRQFEESRGSAVAPSKQVTSSSAHHPR